MPLWAQFTGSSYQALSSSLSADQAINVFVESREIPGSPKQLTLYGTPGLKHETTLATTVCRGWFTQDGQTWVTVGDTLYERTAAGTYVSRGTITDDGLPVSYASNGQGGDQLAIVGGGELKVLDLTTNVLGAAIALPFSNPVMIVFQDGYGLINEADTPRVWFSSLEDFTMWDALDFFARSNASDNVVAMVVTRDRIAVLGSKTSTMYYDSGDADNPFLPYPGTTTQVGFIAPWTCGIYNDNIIGLARSANGEPRVVRGTDTNFSTVSTPPIDLFLANCATLDSAEALLYEQEGHAFFALTCPGSPEPVQTYVYDMLESDRQQSPQWHARAGWDEAQGAFTRWRARGATAADQVVLVGDYETGDIYTLDLETYTDNGATLVRERTAPYPSAENQWFFVDQIELGTQAGVGTNSGQGDTPQAELLISRDAAKTWVSAGLAALGTMSAFLQRTIWRRLGRVRADRFVVRVRQTDPVKCVWGPGLWLRIANGTGQL